MKKGYCWDMLCILDGFLENFINFVLLLVDKFLNDILLIYD